MFKIGDIVQVKPTDKIIEMFKDQGPRWIKSSTYQRLKNKKLVVKSIPPNFWSGSYVEVLDEGTGFSVQLNEAIFEISFNEIDEEELIDLLT